MEFHRGYITAMTISSRSHFIQWYISPVYYRVRSEFLVLKIFLELFL